MFKSGVIVILGTVFSHTILFIANPMIYNKYGVNSFGHYHFALTLSNVLVSISSLRYNQAILPSECRLESAKILIISIVLSLIFSIIGIIICFIGFYSFELPLLIQFWILVFCFSVYQTCLFYLIRNGKYLQLGLLRFFSNLNFVFLSIYCLKPYTLETLLRAKIFGFLVCISGFFINIINEIKHVNFKSLKVILVKYIHFPKYTLIGGFCDALAINSCPLMLKMICGSFEYGLFAAAQICIALPAGIIAGAVKEIMIKKFNHLKEKNDVQCIKSIFIKFNIVCLVVFLIAYVIIYYFGVFTVGMLGYKNATSIAGILKILVLAIPFKTMGTIFSPLFPIFGKLKELGQWQLTYFIVLLVLFLAGLYFKLEFYKFIYYFTLIEICIYTNFLYKQFEVIQKHVRHQCNY